MDAAKTPKPNYDGDGDYDSDGDAINSEMSDEHLACVDHDARDRG
jgi:hypothetical protein